MFKSVSIYTLAYADLVLLWGLFIFLGIGGYRHDRLFSAGSELYWAHVALICMMTVAIVIMHRSSRRKTGNAGKPSQQTGERTVASFSPSDLGLIKMMPNATVGGGMVFPSGLVTSKKVIKLTDNFEDNVRRCAAILE